MAPGASRIGQRSKKPPKYSMATPYRFVSSEACWLGRPVSGSITHQLKVKASSVRSKPCKPSSTAIQLRINAERARDEQAAGVWDGDLRSTLKLPAVWLGAGGLFR